MTEASASDGHGDLVALLQRTIMDLLDPASFVELDQVAKICGFSTWEAWMATARVEWGTLFRKGIGSLIHVIPVEKRRQILARLVRLQIDQANR